MKITISKSTGQRIDKFLAKKYPGRSRRFLQTEIKEGKILVNGKKITPSYKLKEKDRVSIDKNNLPIYKSRKISTSEIKPNPQIGFKIIAEQKDFVVIEKPAGLSVHPAENFGAIYPRQSAHLVNGLLAKYPEIKEVGEDPLRPGIVHRLDKDTSGLMVVARNQKSFQYFKQLFKERKAEKKYLAVVWGDFNHPLIPSFARKEKRKTLPLAKGEKERGSEWHTIQTPIGKSKADLTRQATSKFSDKLINPKKAITHWRVFSKMKNPLFPPSEKGEVTKTSLLEVKIDTGRKHQIRVHLHSIGHSVVGDQKYQTKLVKEKNKEFSRHLLHAHQLKFKYLDGEDYEFESPLPKEFQIA